MKLYRFFLIILVLGMMFLIGCSNEDGAYLTIGEVTFGVEVVRDVESQVRGLSGRESLGENEGMLFVYDESEKRVFWMKGMKFDLDIIFINDEVVVDMVENLQAPVGDEEPASYESKEVCDMVLEVKAGVVEDYGIEVGDDIDPVK